MNTEFIKVDVCGHTLMMDANEFCDMFHFAKMYSLNEYRNCQTEAEKQELLRKSMNAEQLYNFFANAKNYSLKTQKEDENR